MRQKSVIFLFTGLMVSVLCFAGGKGRYFSVSIYQNGKIVVPDSGVYGLDKAPFVIIEDFEGIEGVYLNASFHPQYFNLKPEDSIPDFNYINSKVIADDTFNTGQSLFVDDELLSYWFYDKKYNWYRFDRGLKIDGDKITGNRTVTSFFFDSDSLAALPVEKVKSNIYLFFFALQQNPDGDPERVLQREKFMIRWK